MIKTATAVLALGAGLLCAQNLEPPKTFEVVSIKLTPDPPVHTGMLPVPGTLTINNYSIGRLILEVMRLKGYQFLGAPPWTENEHYDVVAKVAAPANFTAMLQMMNGVLADRFQFMYHKEQREVPMYALTIAKGGPKMKAADPEKAKGRSYGLHPSLRGVELRAFAMPMRMLADVLSGQLQCPVSDETHLDGAFEFTLEYHPDDLRRKEASPDAAQDPAWLSIYGALPQQLGLRLERRRGPVEVVVVDHIERPVLN